METLDSEILVLGLLQSQRNRWLNFILFCYKAIWNSTLCPWFFSRSLSWSFHFLSLFLFLKCFLNYTLERVLSKVRNLVRVNSYRCYFFLPTPAKNLCLAGGTEADGRVARPPAPGSVLGIHAPPNPKQLGCCSTPVLAEPGGAGSERWTASWDLSSR